jgi:hypothetical protein
MLVGGKDVDHFQSATSVSGDVNAVLFGLGPKPSQSGMSMHFLRQSPLTFSGIYLF